MSETALREEATALFRDLGLDERGITTAWLAFDAHPKGTVQIALESFEGRNPSGLFLFFVGRGEHMRRNGGKKRTGWKWQRGTHSGTYVRDPRGTDPLPMGYGQ